MKEFFSALLRNKFFRGSVLFTGANFLVGFLNYLFNSLTAKALGPQGYGEIAAMFAYLSILSIPILAVSTDIIRRLGGKDKVKVQTAVLWENWMWKKVSSKWFLLIPYFLSGLILPRLTNLSQASSFVLLIIFITTIIGSFYLAVLQGLHWFKFFSFIIVFAAVVKLLGPTIHISNLDQIDTIFIFLITSTLLSIGVMVLFLRKAFPKKTVGISKYSSKSSLKVFANKSLFITVLSLIGITFLNNLDVIYVKKFFSSNEAGIYSAWSLFAKIVLYICGPVISLGLIFFSSSKYKKHHERVLTLSLVLLSVMGIFLSLTYFTFGKELVLLLFSKEYLSVLPFMLQSSIFGVLYTAIFLMNNFLLAKNSPMSLIGLVGVLVYGCLLLFYGKSLTAIYTVNVYFSLFLLGVYLCAIFYYNMKLWKPKSPTTS